MTGAARIRIVVTILCFLVGCTYRDIPPNTFDCKNSTLKVILEETVDPTSCLAIDGSITISATGGFTPYSFSINSDPYQSNGVFEHLGQGSHTLYAKDANDCEKWIQVEITAPGSTLDADVVSTPDNECVSNDGTITLTGKGGTPPYTYQFGTDPAGTTNTWSNLKPGSYTFIVRDDTDPFPCNKTINVLVKHGDTETKLSTQVMPIFAASCAFDGCHDGSNGATRNWNIVANVQAHAAVIKARTANKSMPPLGSAPPLTNEEIQLIACWVDDGAKDN